MLKKCQHNVAEPTGRPFGGCAILYRKSLSQYVTVHKSISTRFCAMTITSPMQSLLLICVYLPTNYGTTQSYDQYLESLGELKDFIDSQVFDNIIIAGDFNVDFNHHSTSSEYLIRFMNDLQLCAVGVLSCYNINFTYERDDGLVHSWPDHILTFNYCAGDISTVKCIHSPDNFSDHVPISFNLCCNLQPISNTDIASSYPNINAQSNFDWIKIDSMLIEAYQSYVEASLPIIPPDLLNCSTIGCKLHQQDIDIVCDHLFSCLCAAGQHCFPRYSKRSKVLPG